MGWWLLRLSAKILALLRLSVNFFQLRLTKKLKINCFCFKELNINKPVFFFYLLKQNKGLGIVVYRQCVLQTVTSLRVVSLVTNITPQ